MKKMFLVLIAFLCLSGIIVAQGKMALSVQGGIAIPTGDFGDAAGMGFGGSTTFMYEVSPMLHITGSIGYTTWGPKEDLPEGFDYSFSSIPVLVGAKYVLGKGNFLPYVSAELGMHFLSSTVKSSFFGQTFEQSDSEAKFGFAPGAGFFFAFNPKTMLDVNLKYNIISTEGSSTSYLGINAGVAFAL